MGQKTDPGLPSPREGELNPEMGRQPIIWQHFAKSPGWVDPIKVL